MKNINELRSIHTISAGSDEAEPVFEQAPVYRKITRSPGEEFAARCAQYGAPAGIPDALAALILHKHKTVQVSANGIAFDHLGSTYRYFHPESKTCLSKVGEKIIVSYDPDDFSFVYVLSPEGKFIEAIPRDGETKWFDAAMDEQIAKYRRVYQHVHEGLRKTHAATTKREHDRAKANSEALQFVNEMPAGGRVPESEAETPAAAADITSRIKELRAARADVKAREDRISDRVAAERGSVDALIPDREVGRNRLESKIENEEAETLVDELSELV